MVGETAIASQGVGEVLFVRLIWHRLPQIVTLQGSKTGP